MKAEAQLNFSRMQETDRIEALERYHVLDTMPEVAYDDATLLASSVCDTPIAVLALVAQNREWFKSKIGIAQRELPRHASFCSQAILNPAEILIVHDAAGDLRFANCALVAREPYVRFFAGAPLVTEDGYAIGAIAVMDRVPRELSAKQASALQALARQIVSQLELRRHVFDPVLKAEIMRTSYREMREERGASPKTNTLLRLEGSTDTLTGVHDERAFHRQLEVALSDAVIRGESLSLVRLDVDHFDEVDDKFGLLVGDGILKRVAQHLRASARKHDFVARYGAKEFVVICPGVNEQIGCVMADRWRRSISETPEGEHPVSMSAGVASVATGPYDAKALIEAAGRALQHAKSKNRDRVVGHSRLGGAS